MTDRFGFEGGVEVIAHRGYSARAPENTLAAMELAIAAGADALEFDLHAARDGTPHLFHDSTLGRTTNGRGAFRARTRERLADLDAGSWFDSQFAGEPIPTLERALEQVGGRVARIYPEIKGYRELEDVDRIAQLVRDAGLMTTTVFISMDWDALARVRDRFPSAGVGYIVDHVKRVDEGIDRVDGDPNALLDFDARILLAHKTVADRAVEASIELAAWTVNRVADAARLLELGVTRITTNEVADLVDWKATL